MSALDQLREVMSAPYDLVEDYDTDAVSVASTVEDELEPFYNTECIIAENLDEDDCYLVKWEDYPLDQCTWEPAVHLDGTDLISKWKQAKQELGEASFQRENEKNIKAYKKAQERAEAAKARKYEKREKKRRKLQRRNRTVVFDDDSSDEEPLALAQTGRDLFVPEQRRPAPASSVQSSSKHPPLPRKAPLQQSSEEEEPNSDAQTSDDSMMGELRKKKSAQRKADRNATRSLLGTSMLQKKKAKTTVSETTSKSSAVSEKPVQRLKVSAATTKSAFPAVSRKDHPIVATTTTSKATESETLQPTGMRAIRTAPQKQTTRAINFVDQPKEQQRKEWSTDHHYNKLKYRGLAEKRSRREGTPDFNALTFVNGPPPTLPKLPKAVSRSSGDPYGRRDIANRRVQEDDPDDRPRFEQGAGPLADWEKDKVPLMCSAWKLSSNCPYGAQKCRFLHRTHDPQGRPYQQGDIHNRIPQKYRKPPITCPFWYNGDQCKKTTENCQYAHEDTGWTEINGQPIERKHLGPDFVEHAIRDVPSHLIPFKFQNPPITCTYWLRAPQGCSKTEAVCKYAHWNTGWAPPEHNFKAPPVQIDPNLRPRGGLPKYANPPVTIAHENTGWMPGNGDGAGPPLEIDRKEKPRSESARSFAIDYSAPENSSPPITCYFWMTSPGGCTKSAANCRFAHRNTGWMMRVGLGQNPQPERIDPKRTPRFQKYAPSEVFSALAGDTEPTARRQPLHEESEPGVDIASHTHADTVSVEISASGREHVQSPIAIEHTPPNPSLPTTTSSQLNRKIEQFYNLSMSEMFHSGVPGDDKMLERRAMLLYHPEEHPEETELITRWLLLHDVQVSNLWYDGAWTQFRQDMSEGKSGIIIAHPDFERYIELPGFGEVLKQRIRVWSVGLQPPAGYEVGVDAVPPELRHDRIGVFPHGGFIYITDDVFEHKPQLALRIVKLFFAKIEQLRSLDGPVSPWLEVYDACLLWRLCVRPELMESLYQKCEDNSAELTAQNPDYLSRAELYQLLTSTNYIEQDQPIEPLSLIQDKYPILSERREIAEHPSLDYFTRLANSQEDANTQMIGYYAAMQSADMRRAYRQFYVVHTEPESACAKQWKVSIHNIADVITPELCINEFEKPSKESLFDFLDWAMKPKEKHSEAGLEEEDMGDAPMEISPSKEIHTVEP